MSQLPIDAHLPAIQQAFETHNRLIIRAEPGSGKTTRVPRALLDQGPVAVVEPRRLAAKLTAQYVASQMGQDCGQQIGYQIRFDSAVSKQTRGFFLTEGLLVRRLQSDPELRAFNVIILDEFHERHLHTDFLLAWISRLQQSSRPDLKLVLMSATIKTKALETYLAPVKVFDISGRSYPVEIEHDPLIETMAIDRAVTEATRRLLHQPANPGHILVFLPGRDAINRCQKRLTSELAGEPIRICPLTAETSAKGQNQALAPSEERKVILATNVAETSLTIDGVTGVIDSGLAKISGFAPWSGLPTLTVQRIAKDSATQRTGRAGRQQPGVCLRLFSSEDYHRRAGQTLPEIRRHDLSQLVVDVLALTPEANSFADALRWLEPPPDKHLASSLELLTLLGALESPEGRLTPFGQTLASLPLHPRLAALVRHGEAAEVREEALLAACLISEGMLLSNEARALVDHESDCAFQMELLLDREAGRDLPYGQLAKWYQNAQHRRIVKLYRQLAPIVDARPLDSIPRPVRTKELNRCLLKAFPDRVARYRPRGKTKKKPGQRHFHFCLGRGGILSEASTVRKADYLIVLDARENPNLQQAGIRTVIQTAAAIAKDDLAAIPTMIKDSTTAPDPSTEQELYYLRRRYYGQLVLDEDKVEPDPESREAFLVEAMRQQWPFPYPDDLALQTYHNKVNVLSQAGIDHNLPRFEGEMFELLLTEIAADKTSFQAITQTPLADVIIAQLSWAEQDLLQRLLPERYQLPSGRKIPIHYDEERPWIAARIQEFFGLNETPTIADGRLTLRLKLLAPNQRPAQITDDLPNFWQGSYHLVRKDLARRYPKHHWPEDPTSSK